MNRLLLVYLNLGDAPAGERLSILLVVDDSGSMQGEKSAAVRAALRRLVTELPRECRLGLVGFGTKVKVFCRPTEHREFLLDQIDRFEGGSGQTALYDAIVDSCGGFDEDSGQRYVVVLTDGGEYGSERVASLDEVIRRAIEQRVKVFCLGLGSDAKRDTLTAVASGTGGQAFFENDIALLENRMRELLGNIVLDRRQKWIRPAFSSLVEQSLGEMPAWLLQFSVDQWDRQEIWSDPSHLKLPRHRVPGSGAEADALCRESIRDASEIFRSRLEASIRVSSDALEGNAALDTEVVILGRAGDPFFRAASLQARTALVDLKQALGAQWPGELRLAYLPLSHGVSRVDAATRAQIYAWWIAASRAQEGQTAVLVEIDETNVHRTRNPKGYAGLGEADACDQVASVLRGLALDPERRLDLLSPANQDGRLASAGCASLVADWNPLGLRERALGLVRTVADAFVAAPARRDEPRRAVEPLVDSCGLTWEAMLRALVRSDDPGIATDPLRGLRLELEAFWPPPAEEQGVSRDEYLARLPRLIDESASHRLSRRLGVLIQVIGKKADAVGAALRGRVDDHLREVLFGRRFAGIGAALAFLEELHDALATERGRVLPIEREPGAVEQLERLLLFSEEEKKLRSFGRLSPDQAHARLVDEIRNRPEGAAFLLRHLALAAALGLVFVRGLDWLAVLRPAWTSAPAPGLTGVLVGSLALIAGAIRWRLARQRLRRAVREFLSALNRVAWNRAQETLLAAAQRIYDSLCAQIGDPRKREEADPPEWVVDPLAPRPAKWIQGEGFDESRASRRQVVVALREHLLRSLRDLEAQTAKLSVEPSRFVIDLTRAPGVPSSRAPSDPHSGLTWNDLAAASLAEHWQQVSRRRYFDGLEGYAEYHEVRIALLPRLLERAERHLEERSRSDSPLRRGLETFEPQERRELLKSLDALAYPPLYSEFADDRAPGPAEKALLAHENARNFQSLLGADAGSLRFTRAAPAELHDLRVVRALPRQTFTWNLCHGDWLPLAPEERARALTALGGGVDWIDPWDGGPAVQAPEARGGEPTTPRSEGDI